jgi:hypothetical protein
MNMTITITLPPDLEVQLRERATVAGVPAEEYVLDALAERLGASGIPPLCEEQSRLLEDINRGMPEATWRRYHQLVAARHAQTLTDAEHAELLSLTDEIELAHAQRLEKLIQLAALRQMSVDDLMDQLGIRDPGYA